MADFVGPAPDFSEPSLPTYEEALEMTSGNEPTYQDTSDQNMPDTSVDPNLTTQSPTRSLSQSPSHRSVQCFALFLFIFLVLSHTLIVLLRPPVSVAVLFSSVIHVVCTGLIVVIIIHICRDECRLIPTCLFSAFLLPLYPIFYIYVQR